MGPLPPSILICAAPDKFSNKIMGITFIPVWKYNSAAPNTAEMTIASQRAVKKIYQTFQLVDLSFFLYTWGPPFLQGPETHANIAYWIIQYFTALTQIMNFVTGINFLSLLVWKYVEKHVFERQPFWNPKWRIDAWVHPNFSSEILFLTSECTI